MSFIVTVTTTISLFFILHFLVIPRQESRKAKKEQREKLYAPVYGLLVAKLIIGKGFDSTKVTIGGIKEHSILESENLEQLIYDNLGYAKQPLIDAWSNYVSVGPIKNHDIQFDLVKSVIQGYNQLKKEIGIEYNIEELRTGIPDIYEHLR